MTDMMIAVKPDVLLRSAVVVALGMPLDSSPRDVLSIAHDAGWMLHRRVGEGEALVVVRSLVREGVAVAAGPEDDSSLMLYGPPPATGSRVAYHAALRRAHGILNKHDREANR